MNEGPYELVTLYSRGDNSLRPCQRQGYLAFDGSSSQAGDDAALQEQHHDHEWNGHDDGGGGYLTKGDLMFAVKEWNGDRYRLRV